MNKYKLVVIIGLSLLLLFFLNKINTVNFFRISPGINSWEFNTSDKNRYIEKDYNGSSNKTEKVIQLPYNFSSKDKPIILPANPNQTVNYEPL